MLGFPSNQCAAQNLITIARTNGAVATDNSYKWEDLITSFELVGYRN